MNLSYEYTSQTRFALHTSSSLSWGGLKIRHERAVEIKPTFITESRSITSQKKEQGQRPTILTD